MLPQREDTVKLINVIILGFLKSQTELEWKGFCVLLSTKVKN